MIRDYKRLVDVEAEIFKALGHPSRLLIVKTLAEERKCVGELVKLVGAAQPTVSRHLDVLLKSGVVRRRKEGARMLYDLAYPCLLGTISCINKALKQRAAEQRALVGR